MITIKFTCDTKGTRTGVGLKCSGVPANSVEARIGAAVQAAIVETMRLVKEKLLLDGVANRVIHSEGESADAAKQRFTDMPREEGP